MNTSDKEIETLLVETNIKCYNRDIEKIRKQVISQSVNILGDNKNHTLFHNHTEAGLAFRYSHIQYRIKNQKLVVFAWGEAVPLLMEVVKSADPFEGTLLNINTTLHMEKEKVSMRRSDAFQYYRLMDWVALNNETYQKWKETFTMRDRVTILDQAITGHLRVLAEIFLPESNTKDISAELFSIKKMKRQQVFGNTVLGFNVIFRTPWELPEQFGIGRNISLGCGTFQKLKNNPENETKIMNNDKEKASKKSVLI